MREKALKILKFALAAVLVVSLVMMIRTRMEYAHGESVYDEAASAAKVPQLTAVPAEALPETVTDPNLALLAEVDFRELQQENPDVLGWISIPGTTLSYPILQSEDNNYYLRRTWQKESATCGSIFIDYRSNADMTDFNTVIYGHRMRNGSMFACLGEYQEQAYWSAHPSVYVVCAGNVSRYDIFAAYEVGLRGHVYDLQAKDTEEREAFITLCREESVIASDIVPTARDKLLTLSTCTGSGYKNRWVVQAVLTESAPISELLTANTAK